MVDTSNLGLKRPAQDAVYDIDSFHNPDMGTLDDIIGASNNNGTIMSQLTYLRNNKSQVGHTHGINEITGLSPLLGNYDQRLTALEESLDGGGGGGVSGDYLPLSGGTLSNSSGSRIVLCKEDKYELYVNVNSSRIGICATAEKGIAVWARSMHNYSVFGDVMSTKGLNIAASTARDDDLLSGNYESSLPDANINVPSKGSWRIFSRIEEGVSYLYASVYDGTKWGAKHALTNYVLNQ
jgi:hypothetical protein